MPRPAINDYVFYKIVNVNGDVDLCYVGSTANWKQRKIQHKSDCCNPNSEKHNLKIYKTIRENGGWNEFKMIEIGRGEQLTLTQAHQKEEEYRVELEANMNTYKSFESMEDYKERKKFYRINNADKLKEYSKQYRIDNAYKIKEIYTCDCGGTYSKDSKHKHLKTKKHQEYIKSINNTQIKPYD